MMQNFSPKIFQLNSVKSQSELAVNHRRSFAFCVFGGLTAGPNAERGGREYAAASSGQDLQPNGQEQRRQVDAGRVPRRQQSRPANRSGLIPGWQLDAATQEAETPANNWRVTYNPQRNSPKKLANFQVADSTLGFDSQATRPDK